MSGHWRLAKSLEKLRDQIDSLYPTRSRKSDGSIGDEAHANIKSDHNPNKSGVVTAIDITHDPASGLAAEILAGALVMSRDSRIKYIIWNRRMVSSYAAHGIPAWTWRSYTKGNPHDKHLHISVLPQDRYYDDDSPWFLSDITSPPPYPGHIVSPVEVIKLFQRFKGLDADGVVGPKTWKALFG